MRASYRWQRRQDSQCAFTLPVFYALAPMTPFRHAPRLSLAACAPVCSLVFVAHAQPLPATEPPPVTPSGSVDDATPVGSPAPVGEPYTVQPAVPPTEAVPPGLPQAAANPVYPPGSPYPPPLPGAYAPQPIDQRPRYLPYRDGEPAPLGYSFDEKVRRGPIVGGLITMGVPYLLGLLIASQEDYSNKKGFLFAPGIGPWLTLLTRSSTCDPSLPISDCSEDWNSRFALVLDGLLQTGGAILAAHGIFNTHKRYVRNDWAPSLAIMPRVLGKSPGLSLGVMSVF